MSCFGTRSLRRPLEEEHGLAGRAAKGEDRAERQITRRLNNLGACVHLGEGAFGVLDRPVELAAARAAEGFVAGNREAFVLNEDRMRALWRKAGDALVEAAGGLYVVDVLEGKG